MVIVAQFLLQDILLEEVEVVPEMITQQHQEELQVQVEQAEVEMEVIILQMLDPQEQQTQEAVEEQ